ncbi:MAG: hypothetical protein KKD35_03840 [Elusimicrobia bacterium]|nr:hypothetical protein [Elusimicrobiota bacterium]
MGMIKNKKTFKAVVATLVFSIAGLLIAQSNLFAEDYFGGHQESISLSELVENIQISKGDEIVVPAPKPEAVSTPVSENTPEPKPIEDSNEFIQFWDDFKKDVWQDICKAAQIELKEGVDLGGIAGIKGKFNRELKQYPDKKIALIDEVGVELTGNVTEEIFNIADNPFNIGFNMKMEGTSVVVRRLDGIKYCDEILTLLDLRNIKTILPLKAKRIAKMKPGEIWKLPIVFRVGLSGGIGTNFSGLGVNFSLGAAKEKRPSVSLYRMDEKTIRLRVRLDRATFKSVGTSAGFSILAGDIGLFSTENLLTDLINNEIAREFNKYLAFKFGLSHNRAKGKKILMEFLLDAQNPEQLERLEDFLRGDLGVLRKLLKMGAQFNEVDVENDLQAGADALNNVENVGEESLGTQSSFVGSDHFNSAGNSFNIQVPFFYSRESGSSARYDRYQTMDGDEILHSHQVSQNVSNAAINIPWLGKRHKRSVRQNMYVVNYEKAGSEVSKPSLVYQRYDGTFRHSESTARGMLEDVNDILKYAGTHGEGTNSDYTIDTDSLFPILAEAEANPQYDEDGFKISPDRRPYKSAVLSFSMVFTKTAVRDIINAPVESIMRAVFNILEGEDRKIISKAAHLFNVNEDGKVKYDWRAVSKILDKEFGWSVSDNEDSPMDTVRSICYQVSKVIADFASIKNASDWKEQSKKLSAMLGGNGKSRMGYSPMLKIIVQFVNPKNLYAKVNYQTNKKIDGEENITVKEEIFNPEVGTHYGSQMSNATALRDMFNNPSTLTD